MNVLLTCLYMYVDIVDLLMRLLSEIGGATLEGAGSKH